MYTSQSSKHKGKGYRIKSTHLNARYTDHYHRNIPITKQGQVSVYASVSYFNDLTFALDSNNYKPSTTVYLNQYNTLFKYYSSLLNVYLYLILV